MGRGGGWLAGGREWAWREGAGGAGKGRARITRRRCRGGATPAVRPQMSVAPALPSDPRVFLSTKRRAHASARIPLQRGRLQERRPSQTLNRERRPCQFAQSQTATRTVHTHTRTHAHTRTHTCTQPNRQTDRQTDTYTHTRTHTHTHTHTQTHKQNRTRTLEPESTVRR